MLTPLTQTALTLQAQHHRAAKARQPVAPLHGLHDGYLSAACQPVRRQLGGSHPPLIAPLTMRLRGIAAYYSFQTGHEIEAVNAARPHQTGTAGEIQLLFNGNGHQEEYTRAIASDAENDIESLRVYVFASANKTDYFYQEMWSTETGMPADKALVLQGTGGSKKASIFPTEWKTMPYLKFYCVANSSPTCMRSTT